MREEPPPTNYVAFISYAREDEGFARQLETEIEAYRPPDGRPTSNVFRDRSDFTGSEYHRALESHLGQSESLIVLCSPHARKSEYVGDEIRRFAKLHGPDRIFPILLSGLPDNEAEEQKAFPPALLDTMGLGKIPLGAEYRGFGKPRDRPSTGRYETEWYKLLGNLYGMNPAQIRGLDKQRQVSALRKRYALSVGVAILLVISLFGVWNLKEQAETDKIAAEEARQKATAAEKNAVEQQKRAERAEEEAKQLKAKAETYLAAEMRKGKPDAAAALSPRVYFQMWGENQRPLADKLKQALTALKYLVPRYEILNVGATGGSELRYFRDAEQPEADRIVQALREAGLGDVVGKKIPGYENSTNIRPRHFELWLGKGVNDAPAANR